MIWQGKIVDIYDLWWSKNTDEELPFWIRTCAEYIAENRYDQSCLRIVELCSGTGRILVPLIQQLQKMFPEVSIRALGIDHSGQMNKKFTEKLDNLPSLKDIVTVSEYDLRNPCWDSVLEHLAVNIFILPFNHLGLMGNPVSQENLVHNISRCLVPGGWFVLIDYYPESRRSEDKRNEKLYRRMVTDEKQNRVLFYWRQSWPIDLEHRYAGITYAVECIEWLGHGLHMETLSATMTIYYNSPTQLDALLNKYGLETTARYGGYNGEPLTDESHSQVVIARKPFS